MKKNIFCALLLLTAMLTACGQASTVRQKDKEDFAAEKAEAASTVVSNTFELITAIAPDAHIILKPGIYNFSALTEEEIPECDDYVSMDRLEQGEFALYDVPGLFLEAEESGTVRLITENSYVNVVTLSRCDGAVLKGLTLGHEIEEGECNADVLELSASRNVRVVECGLFGCGNYGISAAGADGLTVINTEIYECTGGVFNLFETRKIVFECCRFHDNDGMFAAWDGTEVLIKNTEILRNRGVLLQGYSSGADMNRNHITFQGCTFKDNLDMDTNPDAWSNITFEDCDFSASDALVSADTVYEAQIKRFRSLAESPNQGFHTDRAEEQNFSINAEMMEIDWGQDASQMLGYAIQDLNGDGVLELAIGPTEEYGAYLLALFTLVDGEAQMIFGDEIDCGYAYLGDGRFWYSGYRSASEIGQGFYRFTDEKKTLICEKFYFVNILDGDESNVTVYYNTTGSWRIEDSVETEMTLENFWKMEPEYEYLPIIPFSETDNVK